MASPHPPAPDEKAKRGNKHYFHGFKLAFLNLLAVEFHRYQAEGRPGAFYDYVTNRFFKKFGFPTTGEFNIDPAEDPLEEAIDDDVDENGGCTTEAEAAVYRARFKLLREVSIISCALDDSDSQIDYLAAATEQLVPATPQDAGHRFHAHHRQSFGCRTTSNPSRHIGSPTWSEKPFQFISEYALGAEGETTIRETVEGGEEVVGSMYCTREDRQRTVKACCCQDDDQNNRGLLGVRDCAVQRRGCRRDHCMERKKPGSIRAGLNSTINTTRLSQVSKFINLPSN